MSSKNLEELLQTAGNPVDMLRNSQLRARVFPVVPPEISNWRDEQRAWRETAVLFDQSYHMGNLYIEGPDALKLLSHLATNSFDRFPVDRAKQIAPCNYDGYVIGDGILFHLEQNRLVFVGIAPAADWIQFHAETGGYDVKTERDDVQHPGPSGKAVVRSCYRFEIQGPNAPQVLEKLNGGPVPEIKFFNMGHIRIAGRPVRALRHGMVGEPGLELWGPYEEREEIRAAIVAAGRDFGLREVGARAYFTNAMESGWIPTPLPAIYTGEKMKAYRSWLPATSFEATCSIGGSFVSGNIQDYYMTPYELGYGIFVKFDHDFIGREALEKMAMEPQRKKVTFAWNGDDVTKVFHSLFEQGDPYKYIDFPNGNYSFFSYDKIVLHGKTVGVSKYVGYSFNERSMLSLGVVDPDVEIGSEVELIWGEEAGGTRRPTVERHRQLAIRAIVSPAPYSKVARETYAAGWRSVQSKPAKVAHLG
jgi:vanillate/3-O-methylgallate O-demethylase